MGEKRNRKKTGKTCRKCNVKKGHDQFPYPEARICDGCKIEINDWSLAPDREFARRVWFSYKITWQDYESMLEEQGGGCRVCDARPTQKRLDVDHDHSCCPGSRSCGRCVRGLICWRCNSVLGKVYDDPHLLRALATYLEGQ